MTEFWEDRYAEKEQIWSGEPNSILVEVVSALTPGRALDLGCGEGGDAVWLAERGWRVTGVDISATAVGRAAAMAKDRGVPQDDITWVTADLATWQPAGSYDLVSAFYMHSPIEFPRDAVLRRAAEAVAPEGHLLIVGHAGFPPWAHAREGHEHDEHHFPGPGEQIDSLALRAGEWDTVLAERRRREVTGPEGQRADIDDVVVLMRR